jgi:hypothetical protein
MESGTVMVYTNAARTGVEVRYHVHVVGRRPPGPLGGDVVDVIIAGIAGIAVGTSRPCPSWADQPFHGDAHDHRWTGGRLLSFELLGGRYWELHGRAPGLVARSFFPACFPVDRLPTASTRGADGSARYHCHWSALSELHL